MARTKQTAAQSTGGVASAASWAGSRRRITEKPVVYRVNWLRAKAWFDRWEEEVKLVENEMRWTVLWFEHHGKLWKERAMKSKQDGKNGHACYAWKQVKMWKRMADNAGETFGIPL